MPETSIIIRTLNEEKHLGNLLKAISQQKYRDYEIIIVDSGSTDKTLEIAQQFKTTILQIESRDFTFGYALNIGCRVTKGKYLVMASAHVLPTNEQWLGEIIAPFADPKVGMVYGRQEGNETSKFSERMDLKRLFGRTPSHSKTQLNYANNANAAVRRELWEKYAFDEYLFGLEDIDWVRHITSDGYLVHYQTKASVYHLHAETWSQVFNRYRREAIAAVRIGLSHPPQARLEFVWLFWRLLTDVVASFPFWTRVRLEEIFRFRYYQWKGSRTGWSQGKYLDIERDKNSVFHPVENMSVVIHGPQQATFTEVPLPEIKPGDVLIKVDYVGICQTDLEVHDGSLGYYRDGIATYPIVPGHEFSGTVERVGSNSRYQERFKIGQRVISECILSRDPIARKEVGVINHHGAYSRYVVIPGNIVHKIPDDLDSRKAALTEPFAVVLRAVRRLRHRLVPGAHIAVMGAGTIGHLCARVLALDGYDVTVFDRYVARLQLIDDVATAKTEIEGLAAYHIIIEATGSRGVLERVIKESRPNATIMLLGFPYGDISYNFEDLVGQEKFMAGSVGGDEEDFIKAFELLPKIQIPERAYKELPLEEFRNAWDLHRSLKFLKIFLRP